MKLKFTIVYTLLILLFYSSLFSFEIKHLPNQVNSSDDDFPAFIENSRLIFIQKSQDDKIRVHSIEINNPISKNTITLPKFIEKTNASFISKIEDSNSITYFFASKNKRKKYDSDIFILEQDVKSGKIRFSPFPNNSSEFESHPFSPKDGSILLFSTDRFGTENGTDIAISFKTDSGWSFPKKVDKINSNFNEITPFIDSEGNLYFSRFDSTNYNIYKADKISLWNWDTPRKLPYPINTEYNEIAPVVEDGKLYFSSDRQKGFGGFDIYEANLCLPILLEVNFNVSLNIFSSYNKIIILDELQKIIDEKYLGANNTLTFNLFPKHRYDIQIINECSSQKFFQKTIETPCIDTAIVKYKVTLNISNNLTEEINLPFFVGGYYRPVTNTTLKQLKTLFEYKLIGLDDSTSFIENPLNKYDNLPQFIEESINNIVEKISNYLDLFEKGCIDTRKALKIQITGFSDPRPISPKAKYFEETIADDKFNTFVDRGSTMDNYLLSKLRAYFTGKVIFELLKKKYSSQSLERFLKWEIIGGGIANDVDEDYLILRKVRIKIDISEKD